MASCIRGADGSCTLHGEPFVPGEDECLAERERETPRRPWREITHVGLRTPAVLLEVKDPELRIRLETSEGHLVLGVGKWVLLAEETWRTTLDKAFTAAQPDGRRDRRS